MREPRRYQLTLSETQLGVLRGCVDFTLRVDVAKRIEQRKGRQVAIRSLGGKPVTPTVESSESVVNRRPIDIYRVPAPVKKRRSGRSNWPTTLEGRMRLKARCAERKELGLERWMTDRTGLGRVAAAPNEYVPSASEKEALHALASQLTTRIGSAVVDPAARIAMVTEGPPGWTQSSRRGGRRVEVALHNDTAPPLFGNVGGAAMPALLAGEAIIFPRGLTRHEPAGDWRRTLTFEIHT